MNIAPDFIRAAVTDIMLVLLLYTMSTPKYSNKFSYIAVMLTLVILNLTVNTYYYIRNDYTSVAKVDLLMLLMIAIVLKPLFRETIAQWCFSFVTLLNLYVAVVIISYSLCDFFPHPFYAITVLRLFLFAVIIFTLKRYILPLYREVLKRWNAYIPMLVGLFINLAYFLFGDDVEQMMTNFMWQLLLLILLEVLIYVSVFYSMNIMAREGELSEENIKMQSDRELLKLSATSMADRLRLIEETVSQQRFAAHDRRHFNRTVLELLEQGKQQDAIALLREKTEVLPPANRRYCENTTVGAAVSYFVTLAQGKGIKTAINIEIPQMLKVDSLELAMALSNLLENAIHSCESLPVEAEKHLGFTCHHVGRLAIEITNSCAQDSKLDKNGFPSSIRKDHGVGTKSVLAFVEKYDGELLYQIENSVFTVRMLV